jgi:hypothetical protein
VQNNSTIPTHIFIEGESFAPSNKLAPGETRQVKIKLPADGRVKFYAGRNGQVITSKFWNGDPDHLDRYPKVMFTADNTLLITTGLR